MASEMLQAKKEGRGAPLLRRGGAAYSFFDGKKKKIRIKKRGARKS